MQAALQRRFFDQLVEPLWPIHLEHGDDDSNVVLGQPPRNGVHWIHLIRQAEMAGALTVYNRVGADGLGKHCTTSTRSLVIGENRTIFWTKGSLLGAAELGEWKSKTFKD
jgi:hypothetical protein